MATTTFGALNEGEEFISPSVTGPRGYLVLRKTPPVDGAGKFTGMALNAVSLYGGVRLPIADAEQVIRVCVTKEG